MRYLMKLKPFILTLPLLLVFSCTKEDPIDITNNERIPIELTPTTRSFVEGGNDFAFKLINQVAIQEKGIFMISPLGVNLMFGMLLEAAEDGPAMDEVCRVMGFGSGSRKEIRNYCKTMIDRLPEMDNLTKLSIANMVLTNSVFGKTNSSFEKGLINNYGAQVFNKSFTNNNLVGEVNSWAKQSTEGLIPVVLSNNDLSADISSVLLNALYFKGVWRTKFDKSKTEKEVFTLESGKKKKLEMMKKNFQNHEFGYAYSELAGRLTLQYGNSSYKMQIYLPDEGVSVNELIEKIVAGNQEFIGGASEADVWLPKFSFANDRIDLIESLKRTGINKAFEDKWLRIFEKGNDSLLKFFQSSKISVDEKGTEAAVVTVAMTGDIAQLPVNNKVVFHCDRPFLFTISETSTGAILFAGVFRGE